MPFTKISSDLINKSSVELDNIFVREYMPFAPEIFSKIYIYGKMLAINGLDEDTEKVCALFTINEDELIEAFKYWEEKGLIKVITTTPLDVEYLPVRYIKPSTKTFSKSKYSDFNKTLASIFEGRVFLPSEYNEYYSCMEDNNIDPDGMLAVMTYCKRIKNKNIGWQYIVKVASNMAAEGCHTVDDFTTKIETYELFTTNIRQLFKLLKIKRTADYDDTKLYKKWTEEYGFEVGTILEIAKNVYGEMKGLDIVLSRYHADGLISLTDIKTYNANKDNLLTLTKNILTRLDVRYNNLDYYAEYYVKEWLKKGFSSAGLLTVAEWCFKNERKTCEKMTNELNKLVSEGITSDDDVKEKYLGANKVDNTIRNFFKIMNISSDVTSRDRDSYNIWVNIWKMNIELIEKAAKESSGEAYPKVKMANLIKEWHEKGYKKVSDIPALPTRKNQDSGIIKHGEDLSELNKKLSNIKPEDI